MMKLASFRHLVPEPIDWLVALVTALPLAAIILRLFLP